MPDEPLGNVRKIPALFRDFSLPFLKGFCLVEWRDLNSRLPPFADPKRLSVHADRGTWHKRPQCSAKMAQIGWQAEQLELRMIIDGFDNTFHTVIVRAIIDNYALEISICLVLDGFNGIYDETVVVPVDYYDINGGFCYEILHDKPPVRPRA